MFDGILRDEALDEMLRRHQREILPEVVQKHGLRKLGNSQGHRVRSICKSVSSKALCSEDSWFSWIK